MKNHKIRTLFTLTLLTIGWLAALPQAAAVTWSGDIQFTNGVYTDVSPAMTQTNDKRIWLFWSSNPAPSFSFDIFYNYTNSQGEWSQASRLTTNTNVDSTPAVVTTQEGKMWVFWTSNRGPPVGNDDIYYKTSSDNGAHWSGDTRLTTDPGYDRRPSVIQTHDGNILVVWYSNRSGNNDIWYNKFDGTWPGLDLQWTSDPNPDMEPCILQDDTGQLWLFWSTRRTSKYALFYKTSIDYGATWSTETQLTFPGNDDDYTPSAIQAQDGKIWVTWSRSSTYQNSDIYYKTYDRTLLDPWSSDTAFVTDSAHERSPTIFEAANTTMYIAWASDLFEATSAFDIFYRATLNEHDVAVIEVAPTSNAYLGYGSNMSVTVKNDGMYSETFTVTAYFNSILVGTQTVTNLASRTSKRLQFTWNTTGFPYGYYTNLWTANTSQVLGETDFTDNSLTNGTVLLTIPGDANGDRIVNMLDKGKLSAHWTDPPSFLGYDAIADFNNDGQVDVIDLGQVNAHWGESW